jgi:molybdopterin molybdotransferase
MTASLLAGDPAGRRQFLYLLKRVTSFRKKVVMIPLETAWSIVDREIQPALPTETVAVRDAINRVLAAGQRSRVDLPPFDKSAMDGYAIRAGDEHDTYRVAGIVPAGEAGIDVIEPGTAVKVMTGAPVPGETGRVIKVEEAVEENGTVRFVNPSSSRNVCKKAEDVAVGDTILEAGVRLGPLEIANLVGCGISEVDVARRVRVALISTGDEIVDSFSDLGPGKIMNVNGPLLAALADRHGFDVTCDEVVRDNLSQLTAAIRHGLDQSDIVLLSGGVSEGDFDYVPEAMRECGLEIHFDRVATKPGKPVTFGTGERGIFFGLPGNPVSTYVAFHTFVLRAAARLAGAKYTLKQFKIRLAGELRRKPTDRTAFVPCRITADGFAEPVSYHGSAHLAAVMQADGFMAIPKGTDRLSAHAEVTMMMFGI